MRPVDADLIGQLVVELLDGHTEASENADIPSLSLEGYETGEIKEIGYVAGDYTRIEVELEDDSKYRITIEKVA